MGKIIPKEKLEKITPWFMKNETGWNQKFNKGDTVYCIANESGKYKTISKYKVLSHETREESGTYDYIVALYETHVDDIIVLLTSCFDFVGKSVEDLEKQVDEQLEVYKERQERIKEYNKELEALKQKYKY